MAIEITEADLPIPAPVANEGCLVALVAPAHASAVLAAMRARPEGGAARAIGHVAAGPASRVTARTLVGSSRIVDMLVGEQLPRMC